MAISTADNTLSTIPFFSENQVLQARDLNKLVDALLDQLRQNRIYNIGLGIVEGFSVGWDDTLMALVVARGFGVSSDGYGFDLGECAFTHVRKIDVSLDGYLGLAGKCTVYDNLMAVLKLRGYELSAPSPTQAVTGNWVTLPGEGLLQANDYCLLYLYREEEIRQASCFNECEGKGAEQAGNYHAVLLPVEDYQGLFEGDREEPQTNAIDLPDVPRLPAFGLTDDGVKLCRIGGWPMLYNGYRKACLAVRTKLATAYGAAQLALEPPAFVEGQAPPAPTEMPLGRELAETLTLLLEKRYPGEIGNDCTDIQYCYAYLHELIIAYAAFYHLLEGKNLSLGNSNESANADIRCRFPGHLGLRGIVVGGEGADGQLGVSEVAGDRDPCRTQRVLPDSSADRRTLLDDAKELLARMKTLARSGSTLLPTWRREGLTDLRLTPGARRFPFLRGRALPFYYQPSVMDAWRVGHQPNLQAYRYAEDNDEHPSLFAANIRDFYRIEGHLGFPLVKTEMDFELEVVREVGVQHRLEKLRECYNLAFDVVAVNLELPEKGVVAPPIAGSARDSWYKNTRADLLRALLVFTAQGDKPELLEAVREQVEKGSEATGEVFILLERIYASCLEVTTFLEQFKNLYDLEGWEELKDLDFCDDLPDTLRSERLNDFVEAYNRLSALLETWREDDRLASGKAKATVPQLDPALGECIRDVAIMERLAREALWRNTFLAGFAYRHPGLVHRGGVENGGTIVLVCKDRIDREGLIKQLRVFSGGDSAKLASFTDAQLLELAGRRQLDINQFQARIVVADFSLPYLCCGAGPVHLHVLPPGPPVPVTITAGVKGSCFTEGQIKEGIQVNFTVSEPGGTVSFLIDDTVVGDTYTDAPFTGEERITGLTPAAFSDGKLDVRVSYDLAGRVAEDVVTIYHEPGLQIEEFAYLETFHKGGNSWVCYSLKMSTAAALENRLVYLGDQPVDYDPETGKLIVPLNVLLEQSGGRVEVSLNDCVNEELLDFCRPLKREIVLKRDCKIDGLCKLSCATEVARITEFSGEVRLTRQQLSSGVIELCPAVPGVSFEVLEANMVEDETTFFPGGLVLEKHAETEGETLRSYHLVLDFDQFGDAASGEGDALGCYRNNGLFPFQSNENMPKGYLNRIRLRYHFGNCRTTYQEITILISQKKGNEDPADPAGGATESPGVVSGAVPSPINATLNARRAARQAELTDLGEAEDGVTADPAFGRAFSYLSVAGEGANPNAGLDATLKALQKMLKSTPDRASFVRKAGEIVGTSFLDKLALQKEAAELTAAENKLIEKLTKGLEGLDVSANATFRAWSVSELYGGPDRSRLTAIGKKLRE